MSVIPRKLTANQIHTLKLLYKFRFLSPGLLAKYRGTKTWSAQNTLNILSRYELVDKRHSKLHKIDRKPASYHLTPRALNLLRDEYGLNELVLHARYKDRTVGQPFIDTHQEVVKMYLSIRSSHPDEFKIFTKYEIHGIEKFPQPLPDLYLKRVKTHDAKPNQIMVEYITEGQQLWVSNKRIDQYIDHFEDEGWPDDRYPAVLLCVNRSSTRKKLERYTSRSMERSLIDKDRLKINIRSSSEI